MKKFLYFILCLFCFVAILAKGITLFSGTSQLTNIRNDYKDFKESILKNGYSIKESRSDEDTFYSINWVLFNKGDFEYCAGFKAHDNSDRNTRDVSYWVKYYNNQLDLKNFKLDKVQIDQLAELCKVDSPYNKFKDCFYNLEKVGDIYQYHGKYFQIEIEKENDRYCYFFDFNTFQEFNYD